MADPITIKLAAKAALSLAQDKKTRKKVATVIALLFIIICMPLLIIIATLSETGNQNNELLDMVFHYGEIPVEYSDEIAEHITKLQNSFKKIDQIIETEELEVDDIKIKSFFYALFYDDSLDLPDEFYHSFINCFFKDGKEILDDNEIIKNIEAFINRPVNEDEKKNAESIYFYIRYGIKGNVQNGIPKDAFDDKTFQALMSEATKYIGYPYKWGGASPSTSFDCSGFICWSYTQSGVYNLPRTTAQGIYNQCTPITYEEAKAGDLIFFTKTYKTNSAVTHVGIYVGNDTMLHCGDPIGYDSIKKSYWKRHFYGFGRLG